MGEETRNTIPGGEDELVERRAALLAETHRRSDRIRVLRDRLATLSGPSAMTGAPHAATGIDSDASEGRRLTRRRMLAVTGVGLVSGAAMSSMATVSPAGAALVRPGTGPLGGPRATGDIAGLLSSNSTKIVVPIPTGVSGTDTANLLAALSAAAPGTTVELTCTSTQNVYAIDQELPIPQGVRITAPGVNDEQPFKFPVNGYMATLRQAPGSALVCTLASAGFLAGRYGPTNPGKYPQYNALYGNGVSKSGADSAIEVDHIAFDGQNGGSQPGNTVGHAIVLYSNGSNVHDCYVFNTPQTGIVVADANHAGTPGTGPFTDNRIYDNKLFNPGSHGFLVTNTQGSTGCRDGYFVNNVIESPSKQVATSSGGSGLPNSDPGTGLPYEAVRMDSATGWWVANNHAYSCPGSGWRLRAVWGIHLVDNSTDTLGAYPTDGATYVGYDLVIDDALPPLHPAFVNGNQVSAYEGFNKNGFVSTNRAPNATNTYLYFRVTMQMASQQNPQPASYIEHSDNASHLDSQPAKALTGAIVTAGSSTVIFPLDVSNLLQAGMSVDDSAAVGAIPAGTLIGVVNGTTIAMVDGSGSAVTATRSSGSDIVTFPGPTSIGWTYVNLLAGSALVVYRTNELISLPISSAPSISGSGSVTLIDPAQFAGGVQVTGIPTSGQTIVADSSSTAVWGLPPAGAPSGPAGGVLGGTFPNPTFAPGLSTTLTASTTYAVPVIATLLRVTCVGGGGGGGGGGAAASAIAQAGGSGGAAGTTSVQVVAVGANTQLAVTIGKGGAPGAGGGAGGDHPGAAGLSGGNSNIVGTGIMVRGGGGGGGGFAAGGSVAVVLGPAYGSSGTAPSPVTAAGCGGSSGGSGGMSVASSPGGGGGGGPAQSGSGGGGGTGGGTGGGGAAGGPGASAQAAGAKGSAGIVAGSAGGGGGGGANGAAGGTGGAGSDGFVIIDVIG
jgi:hypothetical protein